MLEIKALFLLFKRSIKVRLLTYFLIVSILPILLVGFVPYYKSQQIVERQVLELAQSVVNQLNGNINHYLKEMDLMSKVIYYQINLADNQIDLDLKEMDQFLLELKNNRSFIKDIHILMDDQEVSTALDIDRKKLETEDWFTDSLNRIDEKTWVGPHHDHYTIDHMAGSEVVSLVYPFLFENKEFIILIDMKQEELDVLFSRPDLANVGTLLLVDKFGKVIYSTDKTLFNQLSEQYISNTDMFEKLNQEYQLIYDINFFSGWKITALMPESQLNESFHSIKTIVFILLGVFFIISIVLAWVLSNRFISPLKRLQNDIHQVQKGNLRIRTDIDSIDEVGDLSKSFNKMVEEIEALVQEISLNEKKKKKIEMQSLQYQINPHFLYNTLNSIQWIAKLHKVPDISEMLTNLIKLLRTSLNSTNHLHTLEEELEVLNFYLKIQKHRYPNSFEIDYKIETDLLSVKVPRFILQPLVENMFFHGFIDGQGKITIGATEKNNMLHLAVKDNGRGMPPQTIENIVNRNEKQEGKTSSGIGIHNVDDKIKLYFGSEYGIRVKSEEGVGTVIYIHLPITF